MCSDRCSRRCPVPTWPAFVRTNLCRRTTSGRRPNARAGTCAVDRCPRRGRPRSWERSRSKGFSSARGRARRGRTRVTAVGAEASGTVGDAGGPRGQRRDDPGRIADPSTVGELRPLSRTRAPRLAPRGEGAEGDRPRFAPLIHASLDQGGVDVSDRAVRTGTETETASGEVASITPCDGSPARLAPPNNNDVVSRETAPGRPMCTDPTGA